MSKIEKLLAGLLILVVIVALGVSVSASEISIERVSFETAVVSTDNLNMRQGPSESMAVVAKLEKAQSLQVLGKLNEWYFVYDQASGKTGCVHGEFLAPSSNVQEADDSSGEALEEHGEVVTALSYDEKTLFELVNAARMAENIPEIVYSKELARTAYDKAKDMVENNYFSHKSQAFGTPFEMMKTYGIEFVSGAENIAGNQNVERAYYAWMGSEGHKKNIVNPDYDETGIGVYTSPVYGKIIVQMFAAK